MAVRNTHTYLGNAVYTWGFPFCLRKTRIILAEVEILPRGIQLKKVKKEIFFLGLSFLLFSSFPRHSPKVDKVFFFSPMFLSFLYVFNFFNFLGEKKTFCSRRRNKSGIVRQVYDEITKSGH